MRVIVEGSGSGVELWTLSLENLGSNLAAVLKPWASVFTLHCSNSLSCTNEHLAIDNGGYLYKKPLINCSVAGWFPEKPRSCLIEQVCQGSKV